MRHFYFFIGVLLFSQGMFSTVIMASEEPLTSAPFGVKVEKIDAVAPSNEGNGKKDAVDGSALVMPKLDRLHQNKRKEDRPIETPSRGKGLSLKGALDETYFRNPSLRAARASVKATFEQIHQAISGFLPTASVTGNLAYKATNTTTQNTESFPEREVSFELLQYLYRGGRTTAEVRAAESMVDSSLATLATTERSILYTAVVAYMDVLKAQAVVDTNMRSRGVITKQMEATKDRFFVGDVTQTDVAQSEFRVAQANADLTAATGVLRSAEAAFEKVVGIAPRDLSLPASSFHFPKDLEGATKKAEEMNPDIIAAQALYEAAKEDVDVEFSSLLPSIFLSGSVTGARTTSGVILDKSHVETVGLTLTMPLYEGGATRSRVREAKYTANELYMKVFEARRAVREETIRAWESLVTAKAELSSREAQVHAARIARDGVMEEADLGERTILDALDADIELRDAEVSLITAQRNQIVAEYALASAMGMLVPSNLGIKDNVLNFDAYRQRTLEQLLFTNIDIEEGDDPQL